VHARNLEKPMIYGVCGRESQFFEARKWAAIKR
jgi:hypothetical protein